MDNNEATQCMVMRGSWYATDGDAYVPAPGHRGLYNFFVNSLEYAVRVPSSYRVILSKSFGTCHP